MFTQIWCGANQPAALPGAQVITLPRSDTPTIAVDCERFRRASESGVFFYADFDIEPLPGFFEFFENLKNLPIEKHKTKLNTTRRVPMPMDGHVYFAFFQGVPEACLFAHVGRPDFFKALLDYKQNKNIPDCYGWTYKVLRHFGGAVSRIPDSIYRHRHDTMNSLIEKSAAEKRARQSV